MDQKFATPMIETARAHITALLDGYRNATGLPATFVTRLAVNGDSKFAKTYLTANFSFGTYDAINSRLSAVWPVGEPWPVGVPRQAPADIESEVLDELHNRLSKLASKASSPTPITSPQENHAHG